MEAATVGRVRLRSRSQLVLDGFDKSAYWIHDHTRIVYAHLGERRTEAGQPYEGGGAGEGGRAVRGYRMGTPTTILELRSPSYALYHHPASATLYWSAAALDGSGYDVLRACTDGTGTRPLLRGMPPQTRVLGASVSTDGTLSSVYIAVAQPGNASLLSLVTTKASPRDEAPSTQSLVTLLRDVAPTALALHSGYLFYSVAAAQIVRRCDLDGSSCITILHSAAVHSSTESPSSQATPPRQRSLPTGISVDPTGTHSLSWPASANPHPHTCPLTLTRLPPLALALAQSQSHPPQSRHTRPRLGRLGGQVARHRWNQWFRFGLRVAARLRACWRRTSIRGGDFRFRAIPFFFARFTAAPAAHRHYAARRADRR